MGKRKLNYEMVCSFCDNFDLNSPDGYILEILQGKIDIKKMKNFIVTNFVDGKNGTYFKKSNCKEIWTKEERQFERMEFTNWNQKGKVERKKTSKISLQEIEENLFNFKRKKERKKGNEKKKI